jgi:hypothetical protein
MSSDMLKLIEQVEREAAAEARAERAKLLETLESIARRLAELGANPEPRLTRSAMSPAAKSDYLQRYGREAYWRLPWT